MKDLPNKEYLLDSKERNIVTFSLADILFGYAYNVRATLGEDNVESAWTVNKLSATLSWLQVCRKSLRDCGSRECDKVTICFRFQSFNNLHDVVKACVRRSLTYPLHRNWNLSMKVLSDVCKILCLGKSPRIKGKANIVNLSGWISHLLFSSFRPQSERNII